MPNNDYILRSDAISAFCGNCEATEICRQLGEPCEEVKRIKAIPVADVEPKRKTGHWVYKHRTQVHYHKETGEDVINGEKRTVMVYTDLSGNYPYCPYCDALAADSFMNYCPRCGAELLPEPPKGEGHEEV